MHNSQIKLVLMTLLICAAAMTSQTIGFAQTNVDVSHAKPAVPRPGPIKAVTKPAHPRFDAGTHTDPSKIFGNAPGGSTTPKFSLDKLPKGAKPMPPFAPGLAVTPGMDARQTATETDVAMMKRLMERMAKRIDDMNNQLKMLEARVIQSDLDANVKPLESRKSELLATLEMLAKTYTDGHPRVVETRKQLEELEGQIAAAKIAKRP